MKRPPVTIALVLLVLIYTYTNVAVLRFAHTQGSSSWQDAASNAPPPPLPLASSTNSIADGCYHVFIDVGANIGVQ